MKRWPRVAIALLLMAALSASLASADLVRALAHPEGDSFCCCGDPANCHCTANCCNHNSSVGRESRPPTSQGLDADVSLIGGSWEMINPSATVSWGSDRFGVLGGLSHRSSAPFEDGSGEGLIEMANYTEAAVGVDAYSIDSGWTRLFFSPADGHELHLSYQRNPFRSGFTVNEPGRSFSATLGWRL